MPALSRIRQAFPGLSHDVHVPRALQRCSVRCSSLARLGVSSRPFLQAGQVPGRESACSPKCGDVPGACLGSSRPQLESSERRPWPCRGRSNRDPGGASGGAPLRWRASRVRLGWATDVSLVESERALGSFADHHSTRPRSLRAEVRTAAVGRLRTPVSEPGS